MATSIENVLPLSLSAVAGTVELTEREMSELEGGGLWAGVGMILAGGLLACVIGAGVGVALYALAN